MSRTIQPATAQIETEVAVEEFVWPEFNPSPGYRGFIKRLRLARLKRGLSIADMADEVELSFKLAYEFENLTAPLPFCRLELWCEAVGVPFDDFLAIYWADEEAYAAAKEREATEKAAAFTKSETPAPANPNRDFGFLTTLRAALERIANFFHSPFSTPKETPE